MNRPTKEPTPRPSTRRPTVRPTRRPTRRPIIIRPLVQPSQKPSRAPTQRPITPAPTTLWPTLVPTTSPTTTASLNLTVPLRLSLYSSFNVADSVVVAAVSHTVCEQNDRQQDKCLVAVPDDAVGSIRTVLSASASVRTTVDDNKNNLWKEYSVTYLVLTVGDYYQNEAKWKNPAGSSTIYIKRQAVEYLEQDLQVMLNDAIHELILPRDVWASALGNETAAFAHLAPTSPPAITPQDTTDSTTTVGTFDSYQPLEFPLILTGTLLLILTVNCYVLMAVLARIRRQNKVIKELHEIAITMRPTDPDDDSLLIASVDGQNDMSSAEF